MANSLGYEVVHMITGYDMYLVDRDLLQDQCPPPFASYSNKVRHMHFCVNKPERKGMWMEYKTWKETGDVVAAQRAALEQILLMHSYSDGAAGSVQCLGFL